MVGAADCPLEDKMMTIAYGIDMVNISYISFAATSKAIAQVGRRLVLSIHLFLTAIAIRRPFCTL